MSKRVESEIAELTKDSPVIHVLLTFDHEEWEYGGLLNEKTERTVSALKEYRVPATFFLDANTVLTYPQSVKMIAENGFELALHSDYHFTEGTSHSRALNFGAQDSPTQISRMQNAIAMIREIIPDFNPKGFRAPGLQYNSALYISLKQLGFSYDSSQRRKDKFQPFLEGDVIMFPVNCGDFDSACYKFGPHYVVNVWRDHFNKAWRDAIENRESYFVLLAHTCVIGKRGYTAMLKAILNHILYSGQYVHIKFQTCSEAAIEYRQKIKPPVPVIVQPPILEEIQPPAREEEKRVIPPSLEPIMKYWQHYRRFKEMIERLRKKSS